MWRFVFRDNIMLADWRKEAAVGLGDGAGRKRSHGAAAETAARKPLRGRDVAGHSPGGPAHGRRGTCHPGLGLPTGHAHWQTMVFTVLTLSQMGNVLALRSERESFLTLGPLTNLPLLGAVLLTFALQMATIYIPALNPIFKTEPLAPDELLLCLALSSIVFIAVEMEKWLIRLGWLRWNSKNTERATER